MLLIILQLLFHRLYSANFPDDKFSMSDRKVINQRNVREDPHEAYKAGRGFLFLK